MIKKTVFWLSMVIALLATALPGSVLAICDRCQKGHCICSEKSYQPGQASSGRAAAQADDDLTAEQHGTWERGPRFGSPNHTSEIIPENSRPIQGYGACPLHQGLASGTSTETETETETTQTNHGAQNRPILRPINIETTPRSAFSGTGQSLSGATAIPENTQATQLVAAFSSQSPASPAASVESQWFNSLNLSAPTTDSNHLTELTAHAQSAGYQVASLSVSSSGSERNRQVRSLLSQGQTVITGTEVGWLILVPVIDSSSIIPRLDLYQFTPGNPELVCSIRERQQNLNQVLGKIGKIYHWYTASRPSPQTE